MLHLRNVLLNRAARLTVFEYLVIYVLIRTDFIGIHILFTILDEQNMTV